MTSTAHNKVVQLNNRAAPGRPLNASQLEALNKDLKTFAIDHLKKSFAHMFDHLDDFLFDLADRSDTSTQHAGYFDAMRALRMQRERMQEIFIARFGNAYNAVTSGKSVNGGPEIMSHQALDQLLLVGNDDLEESLAVTNIVSKARNTHKELLYALEQRFTAMYHGKFDVNAENNPVGPQIICDAFRHALTPTNFDLKVKLIVYKIFERSIVTGLGQCYYALNTRFAEAGVLPAIRVHAPVVSETAGVARRAPGTTAAAAQRNQGPAGNPAGQAGGGVSLDDFSALQQLLQLQRTRADGNTIQVSSVVAPPGAQNVYDTPSMITALSALQTQPLVDFSELKTKDQVSAYLKTSIADHLTHLNPEGERRISQSDADTIDIVTMLFEFILDDNTLPTAFRATIARLQIPVLKVAIIDKSFFAKKNHPARRLLNELARSGLGWTAPVNETDDPLYAKVVSMVDVVLNEFDKDVRLFAALLEDFLAFVDDDKNQRKAAAQRLEASHQTVAREIESRITDPELPLSIRNFLTSGWRDVLLKIHNRDGAAGPAWSMALQVADDLVWSVIQRNTAKNKARLVQTIPKLLNGLQDGLTLIAYSRDDKTRLFHELETLHLRGLKGNAATTPVATAAPAKPKTEIDSLIDDLGTVPTLMEEIVMQVPARMEPAPGYDEFTDRVSQLTVGTWVEFIDATGRGVRGKLAWKSDVMGEYTFVDRMYKVVADKTTAELAADFRAQRARVVNEVALLDRALDAVATGLKRYVGGAGSRDEPAQSVQ